MRKHHKQPIAVLAADLHLRDTTPECRTDNYFDAQERKVRFIASFGLPVIVAGDFGDRAMWPNHMLRWFIGILEMKSGTEWIVTPGQHDLPGNNLDRMLSGGLGVLEMLRKFSLRTDCEGPVLLDDVAVWFFPWSVGLHHPERKIMRKFRRNIAVTHQMVIKDKPLWPGQEAPKAHNLLRKFPEFDGIVCGDNHRCFSVEDAGGRWLVNPGSMMRMAADQVDHEPSVFLLYSDCTVERVQLPIEQDVVSQEHIAVQRDRDERIEAFVERMADSYEISHSFSKNMESHLQANPARRQVKERVWNAMEDGDR